MSAHSGDGGYAGRAFMVPAMCDGIRTAPKLAPRLSSREERVPEFLRDVISAEPCLTSEGESNG